MKADDEDEPTRWTSIGWQAALILNRLRNQRVVDEQNNSHDDDRRERAQNPKGERSKFAIR